MRDYLIMAAVGVVLFGIVGTAVLVGILELLMRALGQRGYTINEVAYTALVLSAFGAFVGTVEHFIGQRS